MVQSQAGPWSRLDQDSLGSRVEHGQKGTTVRVGYGTVRARYSKVC